MCTSLSLTKACGTAGILRLPRTAWHGLYSYLLAAQLAQSAAASIGCGSGNRIQCVHETKVLKAGPTRSRVRVRACPPPRPSGVSRIISRKGPQAAS